MANERITEDMVEACLRALGYYDDEDSILVEKQQSAVDAIRKALSKASKTGKGGIGYPEHIITAPATPDMVVVVECKAEVKYHASATLDRPRDYAVDGVLHYARALSPNYTVVAIAVSGTPQSNEWSFFVMPKGTTEYEPLTSPQGAPINSLVGMDDLIRAASFDPTVQAKRTEDLISFSQEMHDFMRDEAELEEKEKPLAVAGTLIALTDEAFAKTYDVYKPKKLPGEWMKAIKEVVADAELPNAKIQNMTQPFTGIEVHPELSKATTAFPKGLLNEIIKRLANKVMPFITVYHDFDVVGAFYGEFLKYTGGDGKGLGIVLTPKHVTELFSLLANVNKNSIVLDPCAGTGGFLISAMNQMMRTATTEAEVESIKRDQLIGVEQSPSMYALAASNMILRGDGKANLYQGSCFDTGIAKALKGHEANVGLVNPPYAKSKADLHELRFVEHMLDSLSPGAIGIAIVPTSCATNDNDEKREIMRKHTLEAVMSMPPELFYPVATVTCVMVFTSGTPHALSDRKTWFGYWRDDSFVKVKNRGRVDRQGQWSTIRDRWVEMFRNREVVQGESVLHKVSHADEWLPEAYMETNYGSLSVDLMEEVLLNDAILQLKSSRTRSPKPVVDRRSWKPFCLKDIFDIYKGRRVTSADRVSGNTRFIGASEYNNGITDMCDLEPIFEPHCLTVPYNGSVGAAFYQDQPFFASDDINVLYPKDDSVTR
ncbi:N-6 DNA methylase [Kocuria rhizophila]|uniref:N-6 DNA methylase n=1 Tax=Kocuria rhizophila TaxID=72000 RepID=UPI0021A349BE|nr:N-6 DNA methylase [Kocuria rhizophila]MCT1544878.1 N-6 DNA methylase [Kocuria rhizophila]MCT2249688.1 N-6 DNA methylase [Kocuria rhizophila]